MKRLAFWFALGFTFLIPWENVIVFPGIGTIAKIIGLLAIGAGVLLAWARGKFFCHIFHAVGLVFVVWAWASLLWSIEPAATIARCITYTGLWLVSLVVYQFARDQGSYRCFLWAYVLGAWIAAFATINNYLQALQVVYGRYAAPGFDPNDLAFYLALAIPMAWYLGLEGRHRHARLVAWGLVPVALFAVLLTGSRSGALGIGVALLFILFSPLNRKIRLVEAGLVLAVTAFLLTVVPSELYVRLGTIFHELKGGTLNLRTIVWRAGLDVLARHPLFGIGAGGFRYAVAPIFGAEAAPHNVFLAIAVENGLVGLSLWLLLMVVAFRGTIRLPRLERFMWLTVFGVLILAFFSLCFEWRKASWLIMALGACRTGKE